MGVEIDLTAIRARADAATPGPWELYDPNEHSGHGPLWCVANDPYHNPPGDDEAWPALNVVVETGTREDAVFVGHARQDVPALLDRLAEVDEDRRETWAEADRMRQERDEARAALVRCGEQRDEARVEVDRLRAETEQWKATYGEAALRDTTAVLTERSQLRRAVAQIRSMHRQYRPAFTDEFDVCSACTIGMELVRWPCDTIKAIEEAIKP